VITSAFAATIMNIAYGIAVQETDDPYLSIAEEALSGLTQAAIPGAFWVDFVPILKYVPSWFPGAGFQKKASRWREVNHAMVEKPFRHVKEQLVPVHSSTAYDIVLTMILQKNGKATPSVATRIIERLPEENNLERAMEETVAQNVLFAAYVGTW
jgi:hypothetical protein